MSLEAKPEIPERRMVLLDELIPQVYPGATFRVAAPDRMRGECHSTIRLKSLESEPRPSLLVVVPTLCDSVRLLKTLDSVERQRHALDLTVVIAESSSVEAMVSDDLDGWLARPKTNRFERAAFDGPFHPAAMTNAAVARFGGDKDLVLALSENIELKSPEALQTMAMQLLADPGCGVVGLKLVGPDGRSVRHAGVKVFETADGSGYSRVGPVRHPREFVHDEHVVLGVSLSCAMTRRETFGRLRGLDEVMLTSVYADLDFCARAIEAGLRNYYFGTLTAAEYGPDNSEAPANREFELAILHERHAAVLASWRVRMLVHTVEPIWPMNPEPTLSSIPQLPPVMIGPRPLRYKVADGMNTGLKRVLGPVHGLMKTGITRTWKLARGVRTIGRPIAKGDAIYRPKFAKDRSHAGRD